MISGSSVDGLMSRKKKNGSVATDMNLDNKGGLILIIIIDLLYKCYNASQCSPFGTQTQDLKRWPVGLTLDIFCLYRFTSTYLALLIKDILYLMHNY